MRIHTLLEIFHHANIRRLFSGIIFTVGLVVLLVQCFGIPSFCWSPVNVSVIDLTNSNITQVFVVKTETKYIDLFDDDDGNGFKDRYEKGKRKKDIAISKEKLELNLSVIARPNISLTKPKMAVKSLPVLVRGKASRKGKVLSMRRHKREDVISISKMNSLLFQSLSSLQTPRPRWSSARDSEMLSVRSEIENASVVHEIIGLNASGFRNISKFLRSYDLMERKLKVYVYKEGEKPIFHMPIPEGIYASEGWFMKLMESNKKFVVKDPNKAHLFYIPTSIQALRNSLGRDIRTRKGLSNHLKEYVDLIAGKYKFWNRTGGSDHFLAACHDWVMGQQTDKETHEEQCASTMQFKCRPRIQDWDRYCFTSHIYTLCRVPTRVPCICARGYEVHSPRVVEAIINECVPVIIADNYVPPFFEILDWEEFAVFIEEKDLPNLRNILLSIPEERYLGMHSRVKAVQQHFLWHKTPVKFDIFHMILHSIWYNRVYRVKTR